MEKQIQIDWATAPDWANWFAVDEDGWGYFYEGRPYWGLTAWLWEDDSRFERANKIMPVQPNWREFLQQRPKE